MIDRVVVQENVAQAWPAGVCHYCGIADAAVDGDRVCWLGRQRNVCNRVGCVRRFSADVNARVRALDRPKRKRTPAEIHEIKIEERRARRRQQRGKGKVA
jgi:hypothetical protein